MAKASQRDGLWQLCLDTYLLMMDLEGEGREGDIVTLGQIRYVAAAEFDSTRDWRLGPSSGQEGGVMVSYSSKSIKNAPRRFKSSRHHRQAIIVRPQIHHPAYSYAQTQNQQSRRQGGH